MFHLFCLKNKLFTAFISSIFFMFFSTHLMAELSSESIYQIDNEWFNQDAKKIKLSSLQGKKQIVALIYTHCLHTCPIIVASMQLLEKQLNNSEEYGFLLVSLTPSSDTPKVLKEFAIKRKLNLDSWNLLTANDKQVRRLAMAMNIKYKPSSEEEVAHSNIITVLDEQGLILFQVPGNTSGIKEAQQKLEKLDS